MTQQAPDNTLPKRGLGRIWLVHGQHPRASEGIRAQATLPSGLVSAGDRLHPKDSKPLDTARSKSSNQRSWALNKGGLPAPVARVVAESHHPSGAQDSAQGGPLPMAKAVAADGAAKKVAPCLSLRPAAALIPQGLWEDLKSYAMLPRRYDVEIQWPAASGSPAIKQFRAVGAAPSPYIDAHLRQVLEGCLVASSGNSPSRLGIAEEDGTATLGRPPIEAINVRIAFEDGTTRSAN